MYCAPFRLTKLIGLSSNSKKGENTHRSETYCSPQQSLHGFLEESTGSSGGRRGVAASSALVAAGSPALAVDSGDSTKRAGKRGSGVQEFSPPTRRLGGSRARTPSEDDGGEAGKALWAARILQTQKEAVLRKQAARREREKMEREAMLPSLLTAQSLPSATADSGRRRSPSVMGRTVSDSRAKPSAGGGCASSPRSPCSGGRGDGCGGKEPRGRIMIWVLRGTFLVSHVAGFGDWLGRSFKC